MAKIDLARRAEIGREKRARTRAQILEAGTMLLAERPPEALTVDAVVEAAGVAKGTFYYHFLSVEELVAAVGAQLVESFDELLTSSRLERLGSRRAPVLRLHEAPGEGDRGPLWARLVVRGAQIVTAPGRGIRTDLRADLVEAIAQGRLAVQDAELATDIVIGIWLQVVHGSLERRAAPDLGHQALDAVLRALGAADSDEPKS